MTAVAPPATRVPPPAPSSTSSRDGAHAYNYVSLQFCTSCDTAFSVQAVDGELKLVCRTCGLTEPTRNIVVHRTSYESKDLDKDFLFNECSRYDRTLAVSTVQPCPKCHHREAKFMKSSEERMALMFICLNPDCNLVWKK